MPSSWQMHQFLWPWVTFTRCSHTIFFNFFPHDINLVTTWIKMSLIPILVETQVQPYLTLVHVMIGFQFQKKSFTKIFRKQIQNCDYQDGNWNSSVTFKQSRFYYYIFIYFKKYVCRLKSNHHMDCNYGWDMGVHKD
jgi:hypothetical protein